MSTEIRYNVEKLRACPVPLRAPGTPLIYFCAAKVNSALRQDFRGRENACTVHPRRPTS